VIGPHSSPNMRVIGILVVPFVLMFGIYVIAHGHYGPGGGFAGGVILAVAVIIVRMIAPRNLSERFVPYGLPLWLMVGGMGLFMALGLLAVAFGGDVLDYAALPLAADDARRRYLSILLIEFGVGAAVSGAMVFIFDLLANVEHDS
jgi:multicomponent Na+:H+ antiporter subunit B